MVKLNINKAEEKPVFNLIRAEISIKEVNAHYKKLIEFARENPKATFRDFSDFDLFIFSIVDTYNFGRSFKDSVNNALAHLEDKESKEHYLNLLMVKGKFAYYFDDIEGCLI